MCKKRRIRCYHVRNTPNHKVVAVDIDVEPPSSDKGVLELLEPSTVDDTITHH